MDPVTKFYTMIICMQVAAFALGMLFGQATTKSIEEPDED